MYWSLPFQITPSFHGFLFSLLAFFLCPLCSCSWLPITFSMIHYNVGLLTTPHKWSVYGHTDFSIWLAFSSRRFASSRHNLFQNKNWQHNCGTLNCGAQWWCHKCKLLRWSLKVSSRKTHKLNSFSINFLTLEGALFKSNRFMEESSKTRAYKNP